MYHFNEHPGSNRGVEHAKMATLQTQTLPLDGLMKSYMCVICGFVYDESEGVPDESIPAGTKWEDVSDTWVCPDCGARKEDFEMVEI